MSMETKGEGLPGPLGQAASGKKAAKREEQYRAMWLEMEKFVSAHSEQGSTDFWTILAIYISIYFSIISLLFIYLSIYLYVYVCILYKTTKK